MVTSYVPGRQIKCLAFLLVCGFILIGLGVFAPKESRATESPGCDLSADSLNWNNCVGSVSLSAGRRYEGPFVNGKPEGLGVAIFANGIRYFGNFKSGDYEGLGVLLNRESKVLQSGLWSGGKFVEGRNFDPKDLLAGLNASVLLNEPTTRPVASTQSFESPKAGVNSPAVANSTAPPLPPTPVFKDQIQASHHESPRAVYAMRKALVIGNDGYQSVPPLRNAVADAKVMAEALKSSGYSVDLYLNLEEKKFKQILRNFKYEVQGGDEVLFFFAGHGVEISGANFLLPTDIRLSGNNVDRDRDQLIEEGIDLKRFLTELEERKAKFTLAVIDACREDPFPKKSNSRSISTRAGLAQTTPATGQMVIFSAGAGQLALDTLGTQDKSPNGLFTRVFVNEIRKPGIPVDRALKNVRTEVSRLARGVNHTQVPAIYDQSEGDFYFTVPK